MKKILGILAITLLLPAAVQAQHTNDQFFFGKNKGQEVFSSEDIQAKQLQAQMEAFKAMVEELKKSNELLTAQNKLLQQQVDNSEKEVVALLKGFDVIMAKYQQPAKDAH